MTTFEQIGINYQYQADTVDDAMKSFKYSCDCCTKTSRCLYHDCDHCAIQQIHTMVVASMTDRAQTK